jgi:hypothetical protein
MGELLGVLYSLNPLQSRQLEKVLGRGLPGVSAETVDQTVGVAVWLEVVPELIAMWLFGERLALDDVEEAIWDILQADDACRLSYQLTRWQGLASREIKLGPFGPLELLHFAWSLGADQCAEAILRRRGRDVGVDDLVNGARGMSSLRLGFYMANGVGKGRELELAQAFLRYGQVATLDALLSTAPEALGDVHALVLLVGWSLMSLNTDLAADFLRRVEEAGGQLEWTQLANRVWRHIDTKRRVPFRGQRNSTRSISLFVGNVIATESPALVFGLGRILVSSNAELRLLAAKADSSGVRPATDLRGVLGALGFGEAVDARSASQLSPGVGVGVAGAGQVCGRASSLEPVGSVLQSPVVSDVDVDQDASSYVEFLRAVPVELPASDVHSLVRSGAVPPGGQLGGQSGVVMPGEANAPVSVISDGE